MKQFAGLLILLSTSAVTIGCSSQSASLTGHDPFQTDGDPFQAAAMSQGGTAAQTEASGGNSSPGYAVMTGALQAGAAGGSQPGWSTTRYSPPAGSRSAMDQQPSQTASVPQDNVQLTFRATSSLPESQTQVMSAADTPEQQADIPAIGNSVSRQSVAENPFQQGNVTNADFTETEEANITQLRAEQPSQASPATLEKPVFAEDAERDAPFNNVPSKPEEKNEWWNQ